MEIFERIGEYEHEQVVFCYEPAAGYKGIIAIHDTTLGPALGGTRFWNYKSDEEDRRAPPFRGMTYKAAVTELNLGGGKAVIIGDPKTTRRRRSSVRTGGSSSPSRAATSRPRTWGPAPRTWTTSTWRRST